MSNKTVKITKHGLMSELYKRDLYLTKDYDYLIGKKIIEYDIKSANVNLCKYYKLLPDDEITKIEQMCKHDRVVYIGIMMRNNRKFAEKLSKAFKDMRKQFFIANRIVDSDILSIKKDAIFVVGKRCRNNKFGNVQFVEKNMYSSYHYMNNIEFYYSGKDNKLDVKGINDESLYQYQKFINILKRMFKLLEQNNREEFVKFMKRFSTDYKNRSLNYEYYKEFKRDGCYTLIQNDPSKYITYGLDNIDNSIDDMLSISYNYIAYILPMFQRHYFKFKK